jgi:LPXTG-site transpeptidase (sortase) family protein
MRKTIGAILNIGGVTLLLAAALLAWQTVNPELPPIPSDVTVVGAPTPAPVAAAPTVAAPAVSANPTSVVAQAVPPLFLPESKLPAATDTAQASANSPGTPATAPDADVPAPAERKANSDQIEAERAQAFPPPAQNLPTRIVIPTLNIDSPVVDVGWKTTIIDGQPVSEWEVADYAVGFLKTTALPGAIGNTVMAGHNNINGEVFKYLILVKVGEDIFVTADNRVYRYTVTEKMLLPERDMPLDVRIQNAQWIAPTTDDRLTLVSCWPYTSNTHRVIIVAKPAS